MILNDLNWVVFLLWTFFRGLWTIFDRLWTILGGFGLFSSSYGLFSIGFGLLDIFWKPRPLIDSRRQSVYY
jgi:hypothetical protein